MGTCWASPGKNQTRIPSKGTSYNRINESLHSSSNGSAYLRVYKLKELKAVTRNFREDAILEEGDFGKVYKGWVDNNYAPSKSSVCITVAVQRLNQMGIQRFKEWETAVDMLGRISHPNIVKLIGYCREDNELMLVNEFMQKGSLENHLFTKKFPSLSWIIRLKIALGVAHGMAFLHESEVPIIYRNFSSSNILLDESFNAKLSNFGLVQYNLPLFERFLMGPVGHVAPEFIQTGHVDTMGNVYSFGMELLEMLTGLRAFDKNRQLRQQDLVDWAKPLLADGRKLMRIMDTRLNGQFPIKDAVQVSQLALRCLDSNKRIRPSMKEVVEALEQVSVKPILSSSSGNNIEGRAESGES